MTVPERSTTDLPACPNCRAPAGRLCVHPPTAAYSGHCRARLDVMNTIDSTAVVVSTAQLESGDDT